MALTSNDSQFSVKSNSHEKSLCLGLSNLQQNGEFVDMTLAADGHFVKVHQIIIALASPYIKDLISSVQCQHPVIFLNKISYQTLAAILEYVYTGEVLVTVEHLREFAEAGKELHIKGLEDMNLDTGLMTKASEADEENDKNKMKREQACDYLNTTNSTDNEDITEQNSNKDDPYNSNIHGEEIQECQEIFLDETIDDEDQNMSNNLQTIGISIPPWLRDTSDNHAELSASIQYTVSNQGSLQLILNRYIYYLKHTTRHKSRQWRCVDYLKNARCPAHVFTKDNIVYKRIAAHTHPFHDSKILKKMRNGVIFSTIMEAEREGNTIWNSHPVTLGEVLSE